MRYPVKIERFGDNEFVATLSHPNGRFQGAASGESREEALQALEAIIGEIIASAIRGGEDIPPPATCERGNAWLYLRPMLAAKAALYTQMRASDLRKADIARAMKVSPVTIDRIFDPAHRSTLPQLEAAAHSMGKHLDVRLA